MRVLTLPRIACLVVCGLAAVSCTSGGESAQESPDDDERTPTTSTILGPPLDTQITGGSLIGPSTIMLEVFHGACDELEGWSEGGIERVTVGVWVRGIQTVSADPDITYDCPDIGLIDEVVIELDQPMGDRALTIVHANRESTERRGFCFSDEIGCRPFDFQIGDERVPIFAETKANRVDITIGSGQTATLAAGGTAIDVTTSRIMDRPVFSTRESLWAPELGVSGSVMIHNRDRALDVAEPAGRTVDGREAWLVRYPDDDSVFQPQVAVSVGPWWVDIALYTIDGAVHKDQMERFLDGLTIDEVPGQLPLLTDTNGWIRAGFGEIEVLARPYGIYLSPSPNCDAAAEVGCIADVGYVGPTDDPGSPLPGERASGGEFSIEALVPDDLQVHLVDMGPLGELVSCNGVPAFDPALLPVNLSLADATGAVTTYTGLSNWTVRLQPGTETWFTGEPDAPDTVAVFIRNSDGSWNVESVVACR